MKWKNVWTKQLKYAEQFKFSSFQLVWINFWLNSAILQDPKKYIQTILTVYKKYECIVRQQFKKDVGFKAALEKACAKFINKNAVTEKAKNPNFSAEFLAAYCHILLKKSNKSMNDTDVEAALDDIMTIFRFIEDKDVFEGFYKRRLAERLVRLYQFLAKQKKWNMSHSFHIEIDLFRFWNCQHLMMPKHRWSPEWNRHVAMITQTSCKTCMPI